MFGSLNAAMRMSLHRFAGKAARHSLPTSQRYMCVRNALSATHGPRLSTWASTRLTVGASTRQQCIHDRVLGDVHNVVRRAFSIGRSGEESFFAKQFSRNLESRADAAAANAAKQEQFLRELNHANKPEAVIDRVHSGTVNTNSSGVALEYIKALARTDRLDRSTLAHLMQGGESSASRSLGAEAMAAGSRGAALESAAAGEPLLVRLEPPTLLQQMAKFALSVALIAAFVIAFQTVMSNGRDGKGGLSSMLPGMGGSAGSIVVAESTRFDDVKGAPEAKADLIEIVEFLKHPQKFTSLGGKLPKGVLLVGPPGTGKTLLAKAVAGEAGVPFFYASGSEFEEVFVGVGARRIRQLFEEAKEHAPCIVFIDEIDAVGQKRTVSATSSNRQTINQLLAELDGFEGDSGIIVIAATNFAESLDTALTRPGRFDRHVQVPLPDLSARKDILELYLDRCPIDATVNASVLARGTPGASGADLANIVNMAAVQASVENCSMVTQAHLEWAKDKVIMGPERKSAVMRPEDLKCTAYHETGHALVALMTPGSYPVHKATIMPRGQALGMVSQLPEHDVVSMSKKQLLAKLDVLMGGRVAEVC